MSALKGATVPIHFGSFLVTPTSKYFPFLIEPWLQDTTEIQRFMNVTNAKQGTSIQVFHTTPLTFALVNLKPILPGHVLVSPRRVVPRVSDLTPAETSDLFLTVRRVGRMVERVYGASSLNIAVQDGVDAGQSVPHVHAHIIPRKAADLDHRGGTDAVYDMLDGEEGNVGKALKDANGNEGVRAETEKPQRRTRFPAVDNEARKPRTQAEMVAEAEMLAREMEKEPVD